MSKHRITTRYRQLGIPRTDVRTVEADDTEGLMQHMRAITDEIDDRPGARVTGASSTPLTAPDTR